ncbi:MAG: HAD family phosphatase [Vallitaleaceae bacterium]|nr:HAD family phosphatase [Vallitaleaceae bacterium]
MKSNFFENTKAVIFDMDGTLIDSMWLWKSIDIEYLGKHNIEFPHDLQKEIEGMSFSETAHYFKKRFAIQEDVEEIKKEWNEMAAHYYSTKVTLKEKALDFIHALRDNGVKIGIGTSNSKELAQLIINRFEMKHLFDSVRTSCEVEKGKPHPDIFLLVASDLGVEPEACVVFEDVPNGLMAARRAGMRSVAIYDDFSSHMKEEKVELSDIYIEDYHQVLGQYLKGIENE